MQARVGNNLNACLVTNVPKFGTRVCKRTDVVIVIREDICWVNGKRLFVQREQAKLRRMIGGASREKAKGVP